MNVPSIYEFKLLDELEQFEAIWEHGVELAQRTDETHLYVVYSLGDFYVERKKKNGHELWDGLRTFTNTRLLEPYLDSIDITKISSSKSD